MKSNKRPPYRGKVRPVTVILLAAALLLIAAGAAHGDAMMLFRRATFICMECVGIG